MRQSEMTSVPAESLQVSMHTRSEETTPAIRGRYWITLTDNATGEILETRESDNLITFDYGILVAMALASGATPTPPAVRGLTMLAVGTGAPGSYLSPDAPDRRQRHLTAEIARKTFSSTQYITGSGAVSSVPTNVVDFTTSFGEGEAVGLINEMSLLRTISMTPSVRNPVASTYPTYDTTIDLSTRDISVNIAHFTPIPKTSPTTLAFTWRLTIG